MPIIAGAGADGVEIRRELFAAGELDSLPATAQEIERQQLFAVYSAPEALFTPQHTLNPNLPALLAEAQSAERAPAEVVPRPFPPRLRFYRAESGAGAAPIKLVVENDQTPDCGILSMLNAFFHAAEDSHLPVSMTFDMANWLWVGQDAFAAAERPARHVGYVHVKAATQGPRGWRAVALDDTDRQLARSAGPPAARRRAASNSRCRAMTPEAVTRHYVNILRAE